MSRETQGCGVCEDVSIEALEILLKTSLQSLQVMKKNPRQFCPSLAELLHQQDVQADVNIMQGIIKVISARNPNAINAIQIVDKSMISDDQTTAEEHLHEDSGYITDLGEHERTTPPQCADDYNQIMPYETQILGHEYKLDDVPQDLSMDISKLSLNPLPEEVSQSPLKNMKEKKQEELEENTEGPQKRLKELKERLAGLKNKLETLEDSSDSPSDSSSEASPEPPPYPTSYAPPGPSPYPSKKHARKLRGTKMTRPMPGGTKDETKMITMTEGMYQTILRTLLERDREIRRLQKINRVRCRRGRHY